MKSLSREEDVQATKKAMEKAPSWFIGIPDKRTPWYFINLDYDDGFVHWYESGGLIRRVVCAGGLEGKGFATDVCPICAYVLELYQEKKRLKEEGEDAKSKQMNDRANRLHAKPEVQFKAIRGQRTLLKTKTGKEWIADWDTEDEDSTAGCGIITLSEAQFSGLTAMINGEDTPFITVGDDLRKRVLWTKKESRKGRTGGKYSAVVWTADEEETEIPDMEIDQEFLDINLADNFIIDEEEVEKVYTLVSGQEIEEPSEDEEVELEEDSDEEPENADLDDLDEDEDPEAEAEGEEEGEFEDDLPDEEDEKEEKEEPAPPAEKSSGTRTSRTASSSRRSATTGVRSKSGVRGATSTTAARKQPAAPKGQKSPAGRSTAAGRSGQSRGETSGSRQSGKTRKSGKARM